MMIMPNRLRCGNFIFDMFELCACCHLIWTCVQLTVTKKLPEKQKTTDILSSAHSFEYQTYKYVTKQ